MGILLGIKLARRSRGAIKKLPRLLSSRDRDQAVARHESARRNRDGFGEIGDVPLYQPGCTARALRCRRRFSSPMSSGVTLATERDEIQLGIFARMAAKFLVVNLQVRHRAARLTPPAITMQHLLPQPLVRRRVQPQGHGLWTNRAHDAVSPRPVRNVCRCSSGRNLKNLVIENSSISGSPWSRLAPPESPHRSSPNSSLEIGRFPASELPSRSPVQ